MTIVILGSKGQVGSLIANAIKKKFSIHNLFNIKILEVDRTSFDLLDYQSLNKFIIKNMPQIIVNAAAYTKVDKAETEHNLAYLVNTNLVEFLANTCSKLNITLLHISTDYVFDGNQSKPYRESDIANPIGIYGKTKFEGENSIKAICKKFIILRTSWVFGLNGENFVKTMIKLGNKNEKLRVVNDQYGAPTSANAIAETIAEILFRLKDSSSDDNKWGIYHFSGYPYVSWAEFARKIFNLAKDIQLLDKEISIDQVKAQDFKTIAKRPYNSKLDCFKIKEVFDINPDKWEKSLEDFLCDMKKTNKQ